MARRKDVPTRHELTDQGQEHDRGMEAKEIDLDKIASDVETVRGTLDNLDFGGTSEGTEEVERSIEAAEDVTVQEFDKEDEELEQLQSDSQEFEDGVQDRRGSSESDIGKITDAAGKIETKETLNQLEKAREAVLRDIEFLSEQIEHARSAREKSNAARQKLQSRVRAGGKGARLDQMGEYRQDYQIQNRDLNLQGIDSFMHYMEGLLNAFKAKVDVLPKVDGDRNSECPFAESLYAERDEVEDKVVKALQDASLYLELLDQEITRLRGNLSQVQSDGNSLASVEAKKQYEFAAGAIEHHIEKNLERLKTLSELVSRAHSLLGLSSGKRWPLGKPQRGFGPRVTLSGDVTGVSSHGDQSFKTIRFDASAGLRDRVLDNLISLGPIKKGT